MYPAEWSQSDLDYLTIGAPLPVQLPHYFADEIVQEPDPEVAPQPVSQEAEAVLLPSLQPALSRGLPSGPETAQLPPDVPVET
jgi:hypothetical protein